MDAMKLSFVIVFATILGVNAASRPSSRYLLDAAPCIPGTTEPNTCYNAPGTAFICCPGQCSDSPGASPACSQVAISTSAPAPNNASNQNVTQTGGISLPKPSSEPTLTYVEIAPTSSTIVANGDLNTTGTYIFYRNKVLDTNSGEQIGFTTQFVRQDVGPNLVPLGSFEQDALYHLQIGSSSIIADGLFSEKLYATLAIVGGTGDYNFAQGTIVVDRVGKDAAGNAVFKGAVYVA